MTDLLILALLAAVILSPVALVFAIAHRFSGSFSVSGKLDDGRATREARREAEEMRAEQMLQEKLIAKARAMKEPTE
jgi:hypothetical protein